MSHAIGDKLPPFILEAVGAESMKQWSAFLADPNPIHLDVEAVKAKGLGDRTINHGPANVAYMMNALRRAYPGGRIKSFDTRFLDNVYEGDRVVVTGVVTAVHEGIVTCELTLDVDGCGTKCSATAEVQT